MPHEYQTARGILRLYRLRRRWSVEFNGHRHGEWSSPDEAVRALARHRSGLAEWDRGKAHVPDDLLDWRPFGEAL